MALLKCNRAGSAEAFGPQSYCGHNAYLVLAPLKRLGKSVPPRSLRYVALEQRRKFVTGDLLEGCASVLG
jgi:hypothetical protein